MMNSNRRAPAVLALALLTLSGCIPQPSPQGEGDISEVRRLQTDQMELIAAIRSDIRELTGRMDELEHRQNTLSALAEQISSVSRRLPPPSGVPVAELELTERMADSQGDTLLSQALTSVRGGKFKSAIDSLDQAISQNGGKSYYFYWLGISHELFGTLEKALGAYHECATSFTKDAFAPAALARQAEVFVKLSDKNSAKLTLQKLISTYPGSTYSQNAKGRLKSL